MAIPSTRETFSIGFPKIADRLCPSPRHGVAVIPIPPVAAAAIVCSVFSPSLLTCVRRISPHFPMDILPHTNICLQYTIRHTANFNPMFASCDVAIKRLAKNEQAAQTCCPSRSPVGDREVFIASHRPPCTTSLRMPCHRRGCRCAHHCAGAHRTAAL